MRLGFSQKSKRMYFKYSICIAYTVQGTWSRVLKGHQKGIRKGEGADGLLRLTLTKAVRLIATIDFERVNTVQFISLEFIVKKWDDSNLIKPRDGALSGIIKYYLDQWYIN